MLSIFLAVVLLQGTTGFNMKKSMRKIASGLSMVKAPPGMKPTPDDTFKKAGEHLPQYVLEMENGAKAIVRTYGGNCFTYVTAEGVEVLGTRKDALAPDADLKPYAGGSPHCFPQFGPGAMMQHGFARGMKFIPEERAKKLCFDRMIFKLVATEETRAVFPYNFEYRFDITLRADALEWDLIVINLDDKPFDVTLGMHTYFKVTSLSNVRIKGPFAGAPTLDKVTGAAGVAPSDEITIGAPVDMLYRGVRGPVTITDSGRRTVTTLESKGFPDTVIWSPYGNEAMGFDSFVCVEPVQASPLTIPVGRFKETKFYQKISCKKY